MKIALLITACFTGLVCALADDAPVQSASSTAAAISAAIVQAKAQEFSHALVNLKLQEVELQHATPADEKKLALVRAQQKAIEQELTAMAIAPLQAELERLSTELERLSKSYLPTNPKIMALQAEIERYAAKVSPRK